MANTNCLEGVQCPACGQEDRFIILARVAVEVTDDGTEDTGGDYEWDGDAPTTCGGCGRHGPLKTFQSAL